MYSTEAIATTILVYRTNKKLSTDIRELNYLIFTLQSKYYKLYKKNLLYTFPKYSIWGPTYSKARPTITKYRVRDYNDIKEVQRFFDIKLKDFNRIIEILDSDNIVSIETKVKKKNNSDVRDFNFMWDNFDKLNRIENRYSGKKRVDKIKGYLSNIKLEYKKKNSLDDTILSISTDDGENFKSELSSKFSNLTKYQKIKFKQRVDMIQDILSDVINQDLDI